MATVTRRCRALLAATAVRFLNIGAVKIEALSYTSVGQSQESPEDTRMTRRLLGPTLIVVSIELALHTEFCVFLVNLPFCPEDIQE